MSAKAGRVEHPGLAASRPSTTSGLESALEKAPSDLEEVE